MLREQQLNKVTVLLVERAIKRDWGSSHLHQFAYG